MISTSYHKHNDVRDMLRPQRFIGLSLFTAAVFLIFLLIKQPNFFVPSFLTNRHSNADDGDAKPAPVRLASHPIYHLVTEAERDFEELRARQSKTLEDAVAEYRRRYNLPPPPHFDKWYDFAKKRDVELIDEFDTIYHQLLPFWALEPSVIRERTREVIGFDNAVIAVLIRDGKVTKMEGGGDMYEWHRDATPIMLQNFIKCLPDMDLAFNIHDEPRIVMQHDDLQRHLSVAKEENMPRAFNNAKLKNSFSSRAVDLGEGNRIKEYKTTRFNRFAHQPTWADSRMSCPPDSPTRACLNDSCSDNTASYSSPPLGFVQNTTAFSDICNSPSLESSFGFFDRPNAFDVAHELLPIFSQSKMSSFQDILYPSPWYYMGRVKHEPEMDMAWENKQPVMYWRGSTTGGFSRDGGWRRQHRQRFLMKIQQGTGTALSYDNSSDPAMWQVQSIQKAEYEHYFDVKFTYIGQCDPGDCDAQREYFGEVEHVNMFVALAYRYLLDIDGNAFSGRYYAWLLSKSIVYKLALFREWHEEWLKPWLHFIPLSLKGDEYIESVRYFDQEETGKEQAIMIAEKSTEWAGKVLRNEDMEVWYFRLLLEYGRLVDDERYNIGYQS